MRIAERNNILLYATGILAVVASATGAAAIGANILTAHATASTSMSSVEFVLPPPHQVVASSGNIALSVGAIVLALGVLAYAYSYFSSKHEHDFDTEEMDARAHKADFHAGRIGQAAMIAGTALMAAGIGFMIADNISIAASAVHSVTIAAGVFAALGIVFAFLDLAVNKEISR